MRHVVAVLALAFTLSILSCHAAWGRKTQDDIGEGGSRVVWVPKIHDGATLAAVSVVPLPDGKYSLKVFIDQTRVYQHVIETANVAGTDWMRVTESWEVVRTLKPSATATEAGWRDPDRRHRYVLREFDDMRGVFAMTIYSDGDSNYWIEISQYQKRNVEVRGMKIERPAPRLVSE